LVRELAAQGHRVTFLERDMPWYAGPNRDQPQPKGCTIHLYGSVEELVDRFTGLVRGADAVIVGSFVPDGAAVGDWVLAQTDGIAAFYDIDTPVTLAALAGGGAAYLRADQVPRYALYLSFTGGPTVTRLEGEFGAPMARALYCSADPDLHRPDPGAVRSWDLGYLGTYSADRQPGLDRLLLSVARALPGRRFAVAGPQYPDSLRWPGNVERIEHLPPDRHRAFYTGQGFTLNITRADMVRAGWSPSVRLFEAAACGTPILSDRWAGLDALFHPGREIIIADSTADVVAALTTLPEGRARALGVAARARVLAAHTAAHRAAELAAFLGEARDRMAARPANRFTTRRLVG
ncbi:MAG: hypothetical protein RLY86_4333, partial [Pseudomonadota bacterium]